MTSTIEDNASKGATSWEGKSAPIAVVMISLNEAHNMVDVLENLKGFAREVFLVDSYSSDGTVDIALAGGAYVVQRKFRGFGDQWNFAMRELPITAPWTMKLDPDERLTDELKRSIREIIEQNASDAFTVRRRLWFMGKPLPVSQAIHRGWKTGTCQFSDVLVNEHPLIVGQIGSTSGYLEHKDSPNIHHWLNKQNEYTTLEAASIHSGMKVSAPPRLFGTNLQRQMWLKTNFRIIPFRFQLLFAYTLIVTGAWRAGSVGWIWARLRVEVYRLIEIKIREMRWGGLYMMPPHETGAPHPGAHQAVSTEMNASVE